MEPRWAPARSGRARQAWEEILRSLGDDLLAEAHALSEDTVARMRVIAPELLAEPASAEQTRTSSEAVFLAVSESLREGSDPSALPMLPWLEAGSRDRARQGAPLLVLIRLIWLGREVLWEWASVRIMRRTPERGLLEAALALGSSWIYTALDCVATRYSEIYESERERWQRGAAVVRQETIDAILDRREHDAVLASARLRYELERHHVAVIAWLDEAPQASPSLPLDAAIEHVATQLSSDGSLVEPIGLLALRAWLSRASPFGDAELRGLRPRVGEFGEARLAVGEPGFGVPGFRTSHFEAVHARRVATLLRTAAGTLTRYSGVELIAVATADLELAQLFAQRALGPLAGDEDATRRLAATLSVYLQESASRSRTAERLGIHANTVSYRVRQAEALLGRSATEDTARLTLALSLLPALRGVDHPLRSGD